MKLPAQEKVALGELKIEYERFFEVSLDLLCISSYDGYFKKVNPAFEKALGYTAEELCSKCYLDFIHPDDIERTTKEVEKQLATKEHVLSFENRYRHKNGTYRWLSWKSAPVGDFMYAAARDVTENKRAEEELRNAKRSLEIANHELESFSYSVAHDLRAPLRSILGFSAAALETSKSLEPETRSDLERVVAASRKMGLLIDALLDLSRLARKETSPKTVDLSALAREVSDELRASSPGRRAEFVIAPDLIVQGEPALLKIALVNLLGNAWKYTSRLAGNARIEMGAVVEDGTRTFFVKDNGAGFDMSYADKLFRAFQRLHGPQEFEGIGVGLVTTQRIVQRHGGRIWAQAAPDRGATFYFTLG